MAELEKYGVRLVTDKKPVPQSNGYRSYPDQGYDRYLLTVSVQENASDKDLVKAGLDPAKKVALFMQLSNLYEEIAAQNFGESQDDEEKFASLKVRVVRSKFMEPKAEALAKQVTLFKGNAKILKFQEYEQSGLALWQIPDANVETLTVADAISEIETAFKLSSDYERLKTSFITGHLEELKTQRSLFGGIDGTATELQKAFLILEIQNFENYNSLTVVSDAQTKTATALLADLKQKVSTEVFDFRILKEANQINSQSKATELLQSIGQFVDNTFAEAKLAIIENSDGTIGIDPTTQAKAKVSMQSYSDFRKSKLAVLNKLVDDYLTVSKELSKSADLTEDHKIIEKINLMIQYL